jgi:hypothetical protein
MLTSLDQKNGAEKPRAGKETDAPYRANPVVIESEFDPDP